jgi:hypothetical protein
MISVEEPPESIFRDQYGGFADLPRKYPMPPRTLRGYVAAAIF